MWRDRDRSPRLPRITGHVLRREHEGRWPDLPADLRGYVRQGGLRETVHDEDADRGSGHAERSGIAVLPGASGATAADPHRSWQRILWSRRTARLPAVPGGERY